jgi:hypothetical protein
MTKTSHLLSEVDLSYFSPNLGATIVLLLDTGHKLIVVDGRYRSLTQTTTNFDSNYDASHTVISILLSGSKQL